VTREPPHKNEAPADPRNAAVPQPLSLEAMTRIDLVRAHHETRIQEALVSWCREASTAGGSPTLTPSQLAELQCLVIDAFVELGEAECRERLAQIFSPSQFELDIDRLVEIVAHDAKTRWIHVTRRYHVEAESSRASAELEIEQRVHDRLTRRSGHFILEAWSTHAKRLAANCDPKMLRMASDSMVATTPTRPESMSSSESLGQKLDVLRINKGWSLEELATTAGLDKKTVLRIINEGKSAHPSTIKKLADALDVPASEFGKPTVPFKRSR
jgi:DNA-binding Xre family transcriptional regulator